MPIVVKMRKQTAVWWERRGFTEKGKPRYEEPVEIKCRWEDKQEEFVSYDGTTRVSSAMVYPDRDTPAGGLLWLGELVNVSDPNDPLKQTGVKEIRRFEKIPSLKNKPKKLLRVATL